MMLDDLDDPIYGPIKCFACERVEPHAPFVATYDLVTWIAAGGRVAGFGWVVVYSYDVPAPPRDWSRGLRKLMDLASGREPERVVTCGRDACRALLRDRVRGWIVEQAVER